MHRDYNTEHFQAFVQDLQASFWGDVQGRTRQTMKELMEADSQEQMAEYLGLKPRERAPEGQERVDSRNGYYARDVVTHLGIIRVRVRRGRKRAFLPRCLGAFQRRAPEVAELIRQAFLRGLPTRAVGRVVAILTEEPVSAQTVSRLTRTLDAAVRLFHEAAVGDDWAYLILDGVWMKVRRAFGPQRVLLLVAYGVRATGERRLLGFVRAKGESQAAWEGFFAGPLPARLTGASSAVGDHGWLRGPGRRPPDGLSPSAPSALLGAQDAQPLRGGATARS